MNNKSILLLILSLWLSYASGVPINIVAAENFYAELAKEIGGKQVQVQSIISNPEADPHLFTTSAATSKALNQAQIIIYNGLGYDAWMEQMLTTVANKQVIIINVASLLKVPANQNPHLWYKPETFAVLAKVLAAYLNQLQPQQLAATNARLQAFLQQHAQLIKMLNAVRASYSGTRVTATEPVYGYMLEAMGLKVEGMDFQWKIMNDSEPTPKMIADYQNLLINNKVKLLFYNSQVTTSITQNMQDLARKHKIVVIGVTETLPKMMSVNQWLITEVKATAAALAKAYP